MTHFSSWTPLHAQIHSTIKQRKLLAKNQPLLIAVSGGQDSLCLAKLLQDLQPKWEWQLAIAHCDHQWSSDAGIAAHVQQIAQDWQIPFYLKTASALKETEASAREWRYQALVSIAQEHHFPCVLTGHTLSDRTETFLLNLIRGAGADGLASLTWQRNLTPDIQLVRPLMEVSRQQTYEFCQAFQLPVWEDLANFKLHYARNRLRQELTPYLKKHFNPQVETAIAQTAELIRADVDYLETIASQLFQQAIPQDSPTTRINRQQLQSLPLALQRRILRQFLQHTLDKQPSFEQIEALSALINAPNRSRTSTLGKTIQEQIKVCAEVVGDWIQLCQTP